VGAIEVDRFAEAWLEELGVSGDSGGVSLGPSVNNKLEQLGRQLASARTVKRKGFVSAEQLAKNCKIGLEVAKKTADATTQLAVQDFTESEGGKQIRPSAWALNFRCIDCDVYCDTLYSDCKSLQGIKYGHIFATPLHFVPAFSMKSRKECHHALDK
jgi:hypothetical protein